MKPEEKLLLKNQLCFPLYAASRKIVAAYHPYLKVIGLTYTQYIVMMVMWEQKKLAIKDLGEQLYLDTGTLTPLLKKLEAAGYLTRTRSTDDERIVIIELTEAGEALKEQALNVPEQMSCCLNEKGQLFQSREEIDNLRDELYKIIAALS